jgi:hypothetical protein
MVHVGIFHDHLEYFMAIWYNVWPFGIACGHLLYFSRFGMFGPRKIWQPWLRPSTDHQAAFEALCRCFSVKKENFEGNAFGF